MFTPTPLESSAESRSLFPILNDDKVVMHLIDELLSRSGLSIHEVSRRLGIERSSLNQYRYLRRTKPSVQWLVRLVEVCGGKIWVELPTKVLNG